MADEFDALTMEVEAERLRGEVQRLTLRSDELERQVRVLSRAAEGKQQIVDRANRVKKLLLLEGGVAALRKCLADHVDGQPWEHELAEAARAIEHLAAAERNAVMRRG